MPLSPNHTLREERITSRSPSIGATPVATYGAVSMRGRITKIGCVDQGVITTAGATITVAVNGTTVAALGFTVPLAGAAAGRITTAVPSSPVYVNEDDVVTFTPSGASGASIQGDFFFDVRAA